MKSKGPSEREIQDACDQLLVFDGWRVLKTDLPHLRGLGVQERGMADRLYIRYSYGKPQPHMVQQGSTPAAITNRVNFTQAMWIEHKKRGGKTAQHQKDWIANERARGGLVLVAGEDFPASVDGFLEFYNASGLARRKLTLGRP